MCATFIWEFEGPRRVLSPGMGVTDHCEPQISPLRAVWALDV